VELGQVGSDGVELGWVGMAQMLRNDVVYAGGVGLAEGRGTDSEG